MFGMMFGDVGQGAALIALGAAMYARWPRWLGRFHVAWPFVVGAGVTSTAFGFLYGECFGPTGIVPVLWLRPLSEPLTLLAAAVALGAVLLAGAYALGTVNRWREGGWPVALYAPTGIAGTAVFLGLGAVAGGRVRAAERAARRRRRRGAGRAGTRVRGFHRRGGRGRHGHRAGVG